MRIGRIGLLGAAGAVIALAGCAGPDPTMDLSASDQTMLTEATGDAKVVAVAMHADWCGACKQLGPAMMQAKEDLAGEPVRFVKADLTDRDDTTARDTLRAMGLESLYDQNRGKTGVAYLVNTSNGEILETISGYGATSDEVEADIRDALQRAS